VISDLLKLTRVPSAGRLFAEAFASLGPEVAQLFKRWANGWRLILAGRDTASSRAQLAKDAARLKVWVEKLPELERYEAAMALHTRVPRTLSVDSVLAKLARETSLLLEPGMEKLVGNAVRALDQELRNLLKRAQSGGQLSATERKLLPHLQALKSLTGAEYDDAIEELVRECVRQLKSTPTGELKRVASKVNSIQGAVAQGVFFRSRKFINLIAQRLRTTRREVTKLLGKKWTTSVIREGRIYIARRTAKGEYVLEEFVDGAIVAHEKLAPSGRLARGFLDFSAQVKAELNISALSQNLRDELRRTPGWGSEDAILLIPSGKGFRALQLVPPPATMKPQRVLIAAPGGQWPKEIPQPASVYNTFKAEGDLSRDACRELARYLLAKVRGALK
jgi:hypothetical protein